MSDTASYSDFPSESVSKETDVLSLFKNQDEEKKILRLVDKWFKDCLHEKRRFERQWYTNMAFFFGRHYAVWTNTTTATSTRLHEPPAPSWRVRLVINKIRVYVRRQIAKLTREKPQPYVLPGSAEQEDRIAAKAAESIYEHVVVEAKFNKTVRKAVFWASVCGSGFIKTVYEPDYVDSSGIAGTVKFDAVTPFHVFVPDLEEEEIENQPYIIHSSVKDLDWIKRNFPDSASKVQPHDSKGISEQQFQSALGVNRRTSEKSEVNVKECWAKPTADYPDGLYVLWSGNTILTWQHGWPYPFKDYPFSKIDDMPSGKFFADSVIVDLIPLQKEYNRTRSQIVEAKNRMSKPQLVAPKGSINSRKITSEPGLIVEYTPGFEPPRPIPLTEIPAYVIQELDRIQADMDDITSQHEISRGDVPPGVEAATAISFLQEQEDTVFAPSIDSIEEAVEKSGKQALILVTEYWDTPRKIKVLGFNGEFESRLLSGRDIQNSADLRVRSGSAFPRSKAAKEARLMELGKMEWLPPQKVLQYLELGDMENLYEELQVDSRQAIRENIRLEQGETVPVNSWDNHKAHIYEHNQFRKTQRFEALPEQIKIIFENHVTTHTLQVQQELMNAQTASQRTGAQIQPPQEG